MKYSSLWMRLLYVFWDIDRVVLVAKFSIWNMYISRANQTNIIRSRQTFPVVSE